jgi:hypothetical protein
MHFYASANGSDSCKYNTDNVDKMVTKLCMPHWTIVEGVWQAQSM